MYRIHWMHLSLDIYTVVHKQHGTTIMMSLLHCQAVKVRGRVGGWRGAALVGYHLYQYHERPKGGLARSDKAALIVTGVSYNIII